MAQRLFIWIHTKAASRSPCEAARKNPYRKKCAMRGNVPDVPVENEAELRDLQRRQIMPRTE